LEFRLADNGFEVWELKFEGEERGRVLKTSSSMKSTLRHGKRCEGFSLDMKVLDF
jgi:hypothetical protein